MTEPKIKPTSARGIGLEVTSIAPPKALLKSVRGVRAAEALALNSTTLYSSQIRPAFADQNMCMASDLSTDELIKLEHELRTTALATNNQLLLGVYSEPATERSSGVLDAIGAGFAALASTN